MKSRKRSAPPPGREERPTEFTRILERLIELEPAVLAAVLVDNDGEAVDFAGALAPFDAKIAGAYLRLVLEETTGMSARAKVGRLTQVVVRSVRRSFLARPLDDGYALVLVLKRQGFAISARALAIAERDLYREAGWPIPPASGPAWYPVHVESAFKNRRRPLRMLAGATWQRVEVLGRVMGLGRDRGYRCRLRSGAELTLVREPAGTWYADELVDESATD
jgi:predicted regulator of Ras-like GTPase activity (Roadblock/LC7/MglB family)